MVPFSNCWDRGLEEVLEEKVDLVEGAGCGNTAGMVPGTVRRGETIMDVLAPLRLAFENGIP